MLLVFKGERYQEEYEPTIFEGHHEMRSYGNRQYCLHLWDTAGQEEYKRLRPMSYRNCNVALLCFALDSPESLSNVMSIWYPELQEYAPRASVVLVGTKSDRWDKDAPDAITQAQIDYVAQQIHAHRFIACSAKNNDNIGGVFDLAINAFLAMNKKKCRAA
jgi:Ras family protein A